MHPFLEAGQVVEAIMTYRSADGICRPAWRFAEHAACRCRTGATGSKFQASIEGIHYRLPT